MPRLSIPTLLAALAAASFARLAVGQPSISPSPSAASPYQYVQIDDTMRANAQAIAKQTVGSTAAYDRLAYLTDTFGPRFSGTAGLEAAIDWLAAQAQQDGFVVTTQPVMVPAWVRGNEWAQMTSPRVKNLHFVGLGMSNGTQGAVVTGEVLVVSSFQELNNKTKAQVQGKIVLFNAIFTSYGETVAYRVSGATAAYALGAVGCLIRSVAPFGLQNPHTGSSITAPIPAGAVTIEDAAQMARMQARGQKIVVSMYMEAHFLPDAPSRNLIVDLPGSTKPDEYVVFGGHLDSWDVAEGAMDDGGGIVAGLEALRLVKAAGIKPQRTLRFVGWVNEENGGRGGTAYATQPMTASTLPQTSIMMESDEGAFSPYSLAFSGSDAAYNQLLLLAPVLDVVSAGNITRVDGPPGADISASCSSDTDFPCGGVLALDPRAAPFSNNPCLGFTPPLTPGQPARVPGISDGYFWAHHSSDDTLERMDPAQLELVAAAEAIWAVTIANLPTLLPRNVPAGPLPGPHSSPLAKGAVIGIVLSITAIAAAFVGVIICKRRGVFSRWGYEGSSSPRGASWRSSGGSYSAVRPGSVGASTALGSGSSGGSVDTAPLFPGANITSPPGGSSAYSAY